MSGGKYSLKTLITGASGFVGRMIVPHLLQHGWDVSVVGRSPAQLRKLFPGIDAFDYSDLQERARGADLLVHLAVANNDTERLETEMRSINVDFALEVARAAKAAGVPLFLNFSSVHTLDSSNANPYAITKREAVERLGELKGIRVVSVFLPLVYGETWSGSLAWLNRSPDWLTKLLFTPLAAMKPTVHIKRIVDWIVSGMPSTHSQEVFLCDNQSDNLCYTSVMRAVDMIFALTIVLLFWWLLAITWALVRISSDGPGLFMQTRVGYRTKPFTCYKFRTMKVGTKEAGTHEVDSRCITLIGHVLRKTKLDELPQVWNILRNEMSLIGPRPCLLSQTELTTERIKRGVFDVKPGITGLAQINGITMSEPCLLALWDAKYIALRGLVINAKIVLATALGNWRRDRMS